MRVQQKMHPRPRLTPRLLPLESAHDPCNDRLASPRFGGGSIIGALVCRTARRQAVGGLSLGIWLPGDVGLVAPDWAELFTWLPGYVAAMALWVALLCGAIWRQAAPPDEPVRVVPQIARLLRDEALLAALRGALAPLLGLYWGSWGAAAIRLAVAWWFPAAKQRRDRPEQQRESRVGRALDLVATVAIIMTGSVWVALSARLLVYVAGRLGRAWALRLAARARTGE